ncbi:hypothetical protein [Amycolatopsis sp. lyj-346]|uniref:hypothetical protein n=1 Tax=Amycolatopsis sp. lyj-346 TaxID=2789289 RepID=UPI0039792F9E
MYDAVTARNIPTSAVMVAGYIDKIKLEPWSAADWARFPNAVKVTIVKKASTNAGHVLDVEPGDATPAQAPGWVRMRRAAGADPTVYMNLSTWPTVRKAFTDQGVAQPHYWVAKYDNNPAWGTGWAALGCVAKQYAGDVAPGIDLSSVADYWPGVDGDDMPLTNEDVAKIWSGVVPNKTNGRMDPAGELLGWTNFEAKRSADAVAGLTTSVANLAQLVAKQGDVDEIALAKALEPAIDASVTRALADAGGADPAANARAVFDELRRLLGTGGAA